MLSAVLWDVDGTLAETERDGHRVAFNRAFQAEGLPWRWSEEFYGGLLRVAGGRERILHDMEDREEAPAGMGERVALARKLHARKNGFYADLMADSNVPLRQGVLPLLEDCMRAQVRMAIVTTTGRANVEALMRPHFGPGWRRIFASVVCAEDAPRKKPDPQAYLCALEELGLRPWETMAIEDSPSGVRAACAAGIPVVVTRSRYFNDASFDGAVAVGPSLGARRGWQPDVSASRARGTRDTPDARVGLPELRTWHAAALARAGRTVHRE